MNYNKQCNKCMTAHCKGLTLSGPCKMRTIPRPMSTPLIAVAFQNSSSAVIQLLNEHKLRFVTRPHYPHFALEVR